MDIEIKTVGELRRIMKSKTIKIVFAQVTYSEDDGTYFEITKASVKRGFKGMESSATIIAAIRANEPDAIYIS